MQQSADFHTRFDVLHTVLLCSLMKMRLEGADVEKLAAEASRTNICCSDGASRDSCHMWRQRVIM